MHPLPRSVKKVLDVLEKNPACSRSIPELAALVGVAPRTLQKHFRRFLNRTPLDVVNELRLKEARRELLRAPLGVNVTEIASRCGFSHLGRFSVRYRRRYGETPSATLKRHRREAVPLRRLPLLSSSVERPTVSVLPFEVTSATARRVDEVSAALAAALVRVGWLAVTGPANARYHVRGQICESGRGRLRITVFLIDALTSRCLWADRWHGHEGDAFTHDEHVAISIAGTLQSLVREAEIGRAGRIEPGQLNAWELTMRALPRVWAVERNAEATTLELVEQAMERAPDDPLPISLAAWCRGMRAGHHLTPRPDQERKAAQMLAARAAGLNGNDALTETLLAAGYTLAHDLATAAVHIARALERDGGSAWAWGRCGWIKAYGGEPDDAIECFQIAHALAPADPLDWLCSIGTAVAHFDAGRYNEAIRWYERGLVQHPGAIWCHKTLAPAFVLTGRNDEARICLGKLLDAYPDLTVARVKSGLPLRPDFLDRASEGLESVGMPLQ